MKRAGARYTAPIARAGGLRPNVLSARPIVRDRRAPPTYRRHPRDALAGGAPPRVGRSAVERELATTARIAMDETNQKSARERSVGSKKSPVTVIGLGAMGQALAGAFLRSGHPTTIWNRSADKGAELVTQGATRAATVAEAVAASPLVVVCVVDYAASQSILEPVASALAGRTLVNLTSDTPERAREAAAWASRHGVAYLDGAVMVPTVVVGQPEALLLYSGSPAAFEAHRATLAALGGSGRYLGADPGAAALYDLGLLDLFYTSMAGLVHAFALVGADGVSAASFWPFAREFLALLPAMAESMVSAVDERRYPGELDNIRMEAVALEHIVEASRARRIDAGPPALLKSIFDRAIAAGHGGDSLPSIIEALRRPPG